MASDASTRICVKNLPKHMTDGRLRTHFASQGEVTDARIMKTKDGKSRLFGFIGFKNPSDATKAVEYFNGTFIDTSRIAVVQARPVGDASIPRPWSKYSQGSSRNDKLNQTTEKAPRKRVTYKEKNKLKKALRELPEELRVPDMGNDPQFREFLEVMRKRPSAKTWDNDATTDVVPDTDRTATPKKRKRNDDESDASQDEYEETTSVPPREQDNRGVLEDDEDTGRIFVRNLPFETTEDELTELFRPFGEISEVHIPIDRTSNRPTGRAYVNFIFPDHAARALASTDGTIFQGRLLKLSVAKPQAESKAKVERLNTGESAFKKQKLADEKASTVARSSLFARADTAVSAIANRFGVSKANVLDPHASNLAVRTTISEAHIINETKTYLESEGVNVAALEASTTGDKSRNTILVKNLPFDCEIDNLRELFAPFGPIAQTVMPPARTLALIEFNHGNHAKKALSKLNYSKFKGVPLFLEMAPMNVFSHTAAVPMEDVTPEATSQVVDEDVPGRTLYIKNVSFDTTEDSLRDLFASIGPLRSVTIAKKKDHAGNLLSRGYGFVEYANDDDALKAIKRLQGSLLDGHVLSIKFSQNADTAGAAAKTAASKSANGTETKLIIRNFPFEGTKRDLREMFSTFGELKSVRIPKKMDGTHRGFAFVEFLTHQEAENALNALKASHFFGRHMVLEWAATDDLAAIQARTAMFYNQQQTDLGNDGSKRKKKVALQKYQE